MNPEHKKYILENIDKQSIGQIASFLRVRERVIKRFLEKERLAKSPKDFKTVIAPQLKNTKTDYFNILAIALLVIIGSAIYSNTLHSSFQFDDKQNIVNNPDIRNLANPRAIFNFMPTRFIPNLSFAVNYHFGRLNVIGYHLFNILIHISTAIMVWWLVILTLRTPSFKGKSISGYSGIIAFFAALIFVSHPVQTQAVTYIVQRIASLASLFYVSSLAFYVKSRLSRHEEDKSLIRSFYYTLSFITVILAMFSKEMTITLPFMILLYELCFFKEDGIDWKHIAPFFITLLIIPVTTVVTKFVSFDEMRLMREPGPGILPSGYLLTQFKVIVTYIRLLLVPINQNLDYDYSVSKTLFDIPTLSGLILLAVIFITAVRIFRGYRLVSFGIFWFFLTLLPESSVIPIRDVIYEHRLYLPMVGYAVFLVSAVYYIFEKKGAGALIIILSIAAVSYSMLAYNRNFVWKDEFTLWNDATRKSPNKARPLYNLGTLYLISGNVDKALSRYNKVIEIDPKYTEAYYNRGNVYVDKGDIDKALSDYNRAIELKPKYADAYYNRGNVYLNKRELDQAISDYNKAIGFDPKHPGAYNNRGLAYQNKGDFAKALSDYNKAIEFNPGHADAYNNRGNVYLDKGDIDKAISEYNKAIGSDPKYANAYYNRAGAYFKKQRYVNSWEDVCRAQALGVRVSPEFLADLKKLSGRDR